MLQLDHYNHITFTLLHILPDGSPGGPDGIRPQHLKDRTSKRNREETLFNQME